MSGSSDYSNRFERYIQSMGRIQSQLQALMEMEKNWATDIRAEELRELVKRKQQLISNVQSLINGHQLMEEELNDDSLVPQQVLVLKEKYKANIHQLLENIITLHERHEEQLRHQSEVLKQSVEEVQQTLGLIKKYQSNNSNPQGSRIDLAG